MTSFIDLQRTQNFSTNRKTISSFRMKITIVRKKQHLKGVNKRSVVSVQPLMPKNETSSLQPNIG